MKLAEYGTGKNRRTSTTPGLLDKSAGWQTNHKLSMVGFYYESLGSWMDVFLADSKILDKRKRQRWCKMNFAASKYITTMLMTCHSSHPYIMIMNVCLILTGNCKWFVSNIRYFPKNGSCSPLMLKANGIIWRQSILGVWRTQ